MQARHVTVCGADRNIVRHCVFWYDPAYAGFRAMYACEVLDRICEVSLTDARDPRCTTGKRDDILLMPAHLGHFRDALMRWASSDAAAARESPFCVALAVCERLVRRWARQDGATKIMDPTLPHTI